MQPATAASRHINVGVHGEPGSGKSVLAGTSPKALVVTNHPDQMSSAVARGTKAQTWNVDDLDELTVVYEWVRHEGVNELSWVWLDNLTLMQDQFMDSHMADVHAAKPHRNQFVPDKPDYQIIQNRLAYLVKGFVNLPINFGWTAHTERYEFHEEDEGVKHMPMLQGGLGKFSQKVCGYMGVIGYMMARQKEGAQQRLLYVTKRTSWYAKTRYPSLITNKGGVLINPHIPGMMRMIQKDLPTLQGVPVLRKATTTAK